LPRQMTKRERVERTMSFEETDRVPIYDLLYCEAAVEHFAGERLPARSSAPGTEPAMMRILGKAIRNLLDMTRQVSIGPLEESDRSDELGFIWHDSVHEHTTWIVERPFVDEKGAIEFLKRWIARIRQDTREIIRCPGPRRDEHRRKFLAIQEAIGDTVNLLTQQGTGLDALRLRLGFETFCYIQADHPGLISEALEAMTQQNIALCHAIADLTLSPAVLTFGDIANKGRLLHSPEFLRKEFFPRLRRINDAWHEHGFKCLFHSDGYLMDVMDDLIEAGIDGLNPIETAAGMNLQEIRAKYGNKLFLAGGIDMNLLAFAEPEQVREACRNAVAVASPGYFLGSSGEIDNSAKLENIIALHCSALETGTRNSRTCLDSSRANPDG